MVEDTVIVKPSRGGVKRSSKWYHDRRRPKYLGYYSRFGEMGMTEAGKNEEAGVMPRDCAAIVSELQGYQVSHLLPKRGLCYIRFLV